MNGHKCTIVFSTSGSDHQLYLICDNELPDQFKVAQQRLQSSEEGQREGEGRTEEGGGRSKEQERENNCKIIKEDTLDTVNRG